MSAPNLSGDATSLDPGKLNMILLSADENVEAGKEPEAPEPTPGRGEIVIFPGFDFRWMSSALAYWRKTGKAYNDEPEPQTPDPQENNDDAE